MSPSGWVNPWELGYNYSPIFEASGGVVTTDANYKYHTFTTSGTFIVSGIPGPVDVLIVGAGGSGGFNPGDTRGCGGGGAGEAKVFSGIIVSPGSIPITVGVGAIGPSVAGCGNNGGDSRFGVYHQFGTDWSTDTIAEGGNAGLKGLTDEYGLVGMGCGGGAGNSSSGPQMAPGYGAGNSGGPAIQWTALPYGGGGGGGMGTAGGPGISGIAGAGGDGLEIWGNSYAAGGGGSGGVTNATCGPGGSPGGGAGRNTSASGGNATSPGSGGGGASNTATKSGDGYHGIVIVRYPL